MASSDSPRVTIGLPVYNGERFLDSALASILGQEFTNFELVVSDNASTDETGPILEAWSAKDSRITVYRNSINLGGSANFNRVLGLAQGEYFRWAGHDDLMDPGMLGACVEALDAQGPSCVLSYPPTVIIDESGTEQGVFDNRLHLDHADPVLRLRHLIRNFRLANVIFGLMRTEAIQEVGGIPGYNSGDLVMLAGLALRGRFTEVPEPQFYRRMHAGMSWRASKSPEGFATWFDSSRHPLIVFPLWRVWRELIFEVWRSPLSPAQKVRASVVAGFEWPRRHWRRFLGELKRAPRVLIARAPAKVEDLRRRRQSRHSADKRSAGSS